MRAVIVLLAASLTAIVAAGAQEEKESSECIPVAAMESITRSIPSYTNFRPVSEAKMPVALKIFRAGASDYHPWTVIYLVDAVDGDGGIMMAGTEGMICTWGMVPGKQWKLIVQTLEGERS